MPFTDIMGSAQRLPEGYIRTPEGKTAISRLPSEKAVYFDPISI